MSAVLRSPIAGSNTLYFGVLRFLRGSSICCCVLVNLPFDPVQAACRNTPTWAFCGSSVARQSAVACWSICSSTVLPSSICCCVRANLPFYPVQAACRNTPNLGVLRFLRGSSICCCVLVNLQFDRFTFVNFPFWGEGLAWRLAIAWYWYDFRAPTVTRTEPHYSEERQRHEGQSI